MGGGQCCLCVARLLGGKGKHINKIPRKSQENAGTIPGQSRDNPGHRRENFVCLCLFGGFMLPYHWRRNYYILNSEKIKNPVKNRGYITVFNSHRTGRKTVTVTEIFVASKEEQQQALHYNN